MDNKGSVGIISGMQTRKLGEAKQNHTSIEVKSDGSVEVRVKSDDSIEARNNPIEVEKYSVKRSYYLKPSVVKKLTAYYIELYKDDPSVTYNQIIEEAILLLCNQKP